MKTKRQPSLMSLAVTSGSEAIEAPIYKFSISNSTAFCVVLEGSACVCKRKVVSPFILEDCTVWRGD